jgi:hypothetical protein
VRRTFCVLGALALGGCTSGRLVRHGRVNDDALADLRARLVAIRGLAFTKPVVPLAMTPEEIRRVLVDDIDQTWAPGDLERMDKVYQRLGLLPADSRLRDVMLGLYQEEAAGFYDPRTKRLVLATRALRSPGLWAGLLAGVTGRDFVGEFLVGHELTHALQDQRWGMPTTAEPALDSHGDRVLARHALLEGDAMLAGFAVIARGNLERDTISVVERQLGSIDRELAKRYPEVPEIARATLAFQYDEGTAFAGWALAAGGWPAVDAAESDPPDSTEQVLHPARYYATRDRPVEIELGGTDVLEAGGWRRTLEDTIGELQVRVLARRSLAHADAARVADGWDGDRLRALARGGDLVLVWMTAWDSLDDAREFADAVAQITPGAWSERRDDRVLIVLAPPAEAGVDPGAIAAQVWRRTAFD